VKFKELSLKEEFKWMQVFLVASPDIAENAKRLRDAQKLTLIGYAMALGLK